MTENIIQKIIDNQDIIIGIEIDGVFFNVEYVSIDNVECADMLEHDDVILCCTKTGKTEKMMFLVSDLKRAKDIKLYKMTEIK